MINIVLFGKPGSGKGTQAKFLMEKYDLIHISTGDIFRGIDKETPLGKEVCSYIDNGGLVPDELTLKVLFDEVSKHKNPNGILYDGFPRTIELINRMLPRTMTQCLYTEGFRGFE